MNGDYLATGFADVDGGEELTSYTGCLSLLDALPYYRRVKQASYELLGLAPGLSVLEVGCGIGDDALRMAELVAPGGRVVGVDASALMIGEAAARAPAGLPVAFLRADARRLPFGDALFDRCRVDRTLQHIQRPEEAVAEMARVLAPGGMLLAYDNDWETFTVSGPDRETSGIIERLWTNSFMNPRIGRDLEWLFAEAGAVDIRAVPSVSVITDFEVADRVYNLSQTARRAVEQGLISGERGSAWLADLQSRSGMGSFLCFLTAVTVVGRKEES